MRYLFGFLIIVGLVSGAAEAQTIPGSATYTWKLPTTGCSVSVTPCDNKPLTGDDAIQAVEAIISTSPIPANTTAEPTLVLNGTQTTAQYTTTVPNGSTLYARFRARSRIPGPWSAQVAKLIKLDVAPGQITEVTVEFKINP